MKMFLIVYCDAADEDVIEAFKKSGVRAYTKMSQARGEGTDTVPKLGTHCWPGKNNALFIAAEDGEVDGIKDAIRVIRREHPRSGVKGFILPMEESVSARSIRRCGQGRDSGKRTGATDTLQARREGTPA